MKVTVNEKFNTTWQTYIGKTLKIVIIFTFDDDDMIRCELDMKRNWTLQHLSEALSAVKVALKVKPSEINVDDMILMD